jgi:26S proteasome regulatory subunit T5
MSSAQPPTDPPAGREKDPESRSSERAPPDSAAMDTTPDRPPEETWADIPEEVLSLTTDEILTRIRLIENDIKVRAFPFVLSFEAVLRDEQVMRSETLRLQHEQSVMKEKIRDNGEKIKQNKVLPYLVGNVVEVRIACSLRRPTPT